MKEKLCPYFLIIFVSPFVRKYRVFIKYCVFSLTFCDFSELCQFCCSAGVLPAWCVYTHCHREKTESRIYIKILNEHPVYKQIYLHNLRSVETGALQLSSRKRVVIENTEYRVSHNYLSYYSGSGNN